MELKERIITTAMRMFHDSGIKAVRMDDIAAECGISKRTLYENFSDRTDLIRRSLQYYLDKSRDCVVESLNEAENAIDEFRILFWHGGTMREATGRLIKDLFKFYPGIFNDFMAKHHDVVIEDNRKRFLRGIGQGMILDSVDTDFISRLMTSYLYGLKKDIEDYDFSGMTDNKQSGAPFQYAVMYFLRGISTEKGRSYIDKKILRIEPDE